MAFSKTILLVLVVVGFCTASPINPRIYPGAMLGTPIFVQDRTGLENIIEDESAPAAYAFFLGRFNDPEDTHELEKRSAEAPEESDDLETAAGTNALRPLFVYRQQVAYRQRVREAIRRRNRF